MTTKPLKPSKRTSSPIKGTKFLDVSRKCPIYEDWKLYLHLASSKNLKVRGLENPPKDLVSGYISLSNEPTKLAENINFIDVENQPLNDKIKVIDVVNVNEDDEYDDEINVLNNAITCSMYEKHIEVRNNNIKDRIIPILQKGLKKLCFKKMRQTSWKQLADDGGELARDDSSYNDSYLLVLH